MLIFLALGFFHPDTSPGQARLCQSPSSFSLSLGFKLYLSYLVVSGTLAVPIIKGPAVLPRDQNRACWLFFPVLVSMTATFYSSEGLTLPLWFGPTLGKVAFGSE